MSVELLVKGIAVGNIPRALRTYLFCCPRLDGQLRCLPRAGGYYDQDYCDLLAFNLIGQRIAENNARNKGKE